MIEGEEYLDSQEALGVQVWVLLRKEIALEALGFKQSLQATATLASHAPDFGFDGHVDLIFAMPDEADLMPAARAGVAA